MSASFPLQHLIRSIALSSLAISAQAGFVLNPSFELNYNDTFPHYGPIDLWAGGSGVNEATGPFHNNGTPIPDGARIGFLQGSGNLSQDIFGLEPGKRYWIQFHYDARDCCGGTVDLATQINGVELDKIANVQPARGGDPYRLRTVPFVAEADTVTLTFSSLVPSGDATVLIDAVSIVQRDEGNVILANPSFEASGDVPDPGLLQEQGLAGWTAEGIYGVNLSGAGPYADNGTPPDQDHVAFLQGPASITQTVKVVPSTPYQLSFAYNATSGQTPHLQVRVNDALIMEEDVSAVGGDNLYRTRTVEFTPTEASVRITFAQTSESDATLLLDDIRLLGETPPEVAPVRLEPEIAELRAGESLDLTIEVPEAVLAARPLDILLQTASPNVARFADPNGALTLRRTVHFDQGSTNRQTVTVRPLGKGITTIQVIERFDLEVANQVTLSVGEAPIKNPSFESTPVPSGVGYGPIAGWNGGSGLNGAGGPFSDNGIIPDRGQVGFAQGADVLSQEVHGLIPGRNHWLQFFYNVRNCCPAGEATVSLSVTLGGREIASIPEIVPVGEGAPYYFHNVEFVPEAESALLEFRPTPTGDATLLLDGVTIVQRDPQQVVVRNPSFEASGSIYLFPGYFPSIAGWDVAGGGRGVNIDGAGPFTDNGRANAGDLVLFMQSGGSSVSQNLTDLRDGTEYIVAFLVNTRNCCGGGESSFMVSFADSPLMEEFITPVGGANPYHVRQATFTAFGTEGVLQFMNTTAEGDHTILFDNVMVFPASGSGPVLLSEPMPATVPAGGDVTLSVAAAGAGDLTYQWRKDGEAVSGQTEPTLVIEGITPEQAGDYSVEVRNNGGSVTSRVARVTVLTPIAGVYNTGVNNEGVVLEDGATDPHYTLVQNPDDPQSSAAFVQDSNEWPLATGDWVPNSDLSKWIGPRVIPGSQDPPGGPAGGTYVYRTSLDLTGYDPSSVVLSGMWAADNSLELVVNGVESGIVQSGFNNLSSFTATRLFRSGLNQIDFRVSNGDASGGPTGLRVENLVAHGASGPIDDPSPSLTLERTATTLRLSWLTVPGYVLESATALPSGWAPDPTPTVIEGNTTVVNLTPDGQAKYYRLRRQ